MNALTATRHTETLVRIELELIKGQRFKLPASTQPGFMEVRKVVWDLSKAHTHSHPLTAKAKDENGCEWTLSLRMSDVPQEVKTALISACMEGDL